MLENFPAPTQRFMITDEMRYDDSVLANKIGRKEGIYAMVAENPGSFGASGHADLYYKMPTGKFDCDGGCYLASAKEVYFWELPTPTSRRMTQQAQAGRSPIR
jgi:hypothetical protein